MKVTNRNSINGVTATDLLFTIWVYVEKYFNILFRISARTKSVYEGSLILLPPPPPQGGGKGGGGERPETNIMYDLCFQREGSFSRIPLPSPTHLHPNPCSSFMHAHLTREANSDRDPPPEIITFIKQNQQFCCPMLPLLLHSPIPAHPTTTPHHRGGGGPQPTPPPPPPLLKFAEALRTGYLIA